MLTTGQLQREDEKRSEFLGANQSGLRERNERLVLSILRTHGALPKAEIARITGLSAQTVSVIMRALETDGLLERGEKLRGKVGQPSIPMRLAPNGALFFGLKVGRRSAELALVNFLGEILDRRQITYRYPTPASTLAFAKSTLKDITDALTAARRRRIAGLGIATPFFLWEWASLIGADAADMEAWRGFDLREKLQDLVDYPVLLGNDATCACGAELVFGTRDRPSNFLYFYIGYFIGGGVVLGGNLYTGPKGNAGAIGPFPIRDGAGNTRQLVDVASLAGLESRHLAAGGTAEEVWRTTGSWPIATSTIDDWMEEAAPAIAHTILSAISIVDFEAILIDGSFPTEVRSALVARVNTEFNKLELSGLLAPRIEEGTTGTNARTLGAASLPLSHRFLLEQ